MVDFDLRGYPALWAAPRRLTTESAWVEHIPFAFLVVHLTQPRLLVELGTHAGDSYCAFCQAASELTPPTRCYAVDTWEGDSQSGRYGPEVLADLRAHHDDAYGTFSSLIQSTFDEAAQQFEDGSIDLLHIDGFHTYEAVRHDFETWRPKLSTRATVLFHDTNERGGDFGVWRFWSEISNDYPHFEFLHGHGLGVLSVGPDEPSQLTGLRESLHNDPALRQLFFELGHRFSLKQNLIHAGARERADAAERENLHAIIRREHDAVVAKDEAIAVQHAALTEKDRGLEDQRAALQEKDRGLESQREALADRDRQIAHLRDEVATQERLLEEALSASTAYAQREEELVAVRAEATALRAELDLIRGRTSYRVVQRAIREMDRMAPWPTRRRQALLVGVQALRVAGSEGPRGVLKRMARLGAGMPSFSAATRSPRVLPAGLPAGSNLSYNDEYQIWLEHHQLSPADLAAQAEEAVRFAYRPKISIVMPAFNTPPGWLVDAVESVRAQTYSNWELCIVDDGSSDRAMLKTLRRYRGRRGIRIIRSAGNSGISVATDLGVQAASGQFIGFLDHDDELKPNALFEVVRLLNKQRDLDFIYSDEDKRDPDGRLTDVFFKPDWSPELLLTTNYVTHFAVYRATVLNRVGGLRPGYDGSQDHDLALRVTEATDRIAHIPLPLYTWRKVPGSAAASPEAKPWAYQAGARALQDCLRRRGHEGDVTNGLWKGSHRVRYRVQGEPSVAILIPTRDRLDLLRPCVESIQRLSTYRNFELIIIDNESAEEETWEYLASVKGRVIEYPGAFNFAHMMNVAAAEARTDFLLFLNNDTEVISPGWIEAMLEYAHQAEIGAVGARLLYPEGHPQHEGIIMGLGRGTAGNVDHGGYFSLGQSILNVSAVTAACLMTRTSVFEELRGFDEGLRVAFNDVDYCLRTWRAGYRVVYTPYAELFHYESASRGRLHPEADETFFRARWGNPGEIIDPYYNPNLDLMRPFRINIEA